MTNNLILRTINVPNERSVDASVNIQSKIYEYLERGQDRIMLNLSQATYVNVHAWFVLSTISTKLRAYGGDLKIWGVKDEVLNTCRLAGMQDRINFYDTELQAMDAFGVAGQ